MSKQQFDTGPQPFVTVSNCLGEGIVKGWSDPVVQVSGTAVEVEEKEKGLVVEANGNLILQVPSAANLLLRQVRGNLVIKGVTGDIQIGEVSGSMALKNAGSVSIEQAHGSVAAKNLDGPLHVEQIMADLALRSVGPVTANQIQGDITARYVNGSATLGHVAGDLSLDTVNSDLSATQVAGDANVGNIGGILTLNQVMGDVRLRGGLAAGKHTIRAEGDVVIRWPVDEPLNLEVHGGQVRSQLPLAGVVEEEDLFSGRLGDGETTLLVTASGRVWLKPLAEAGAPGWDFALDLDAEGLSGIGDLISRQVETQLSQMNERLQEQFGPEFSARMARKAERAVERALRKVERAQKRYRARAAGRYPRAATAAATAAKPRQATAEEQLKILELLEKGIISVDEATTLLEALES